MCGKFLVNDAVELLLLLMISPLHRFLRGHGNLLMDLLVSKMFSFFLLGPSCVQFLFFAQTFICFSFFFIAMPLFLWDFCGKDQNFDRVFIL